MANRDIGFPRILRLHRKVSPPAIPSRSLAERLDQLTAALVRFSKVLLALAFLAVFALFLWKLAYSIKHRLIILKSFQVPKSLADKGLGDRVAVDIINDRLRAIQEKADTTLSEAMRAPGLSSGSSEIFGTQVLQEIKVPGTDLSTDRIVNLILEMIGWPPLEVSGYFVEAEQGTTLVLRFSGKLRTFVSPPGEPCGANCAAALLQQAAEEVFAHQSPLALALYHYPNNLPACKAALRRCLLNDLADDDASAYNLWGLALRRANDYEGAERKFRRALAKLQQDDLGRQRSAVVLSNWGNLLTQQKRYAEAREKYRQAHIADPGYADAIYNWGLALHKENKISQAAQKYREAIDLNPNIASAYHNLAVALAQQKKYEESGRIFADLEKRTGGRDPDVYRNWAEMLFAEGNCQEALEMLYQAADVTPVLAQEAQDGPNHPFQDPFIENLAGRWRISREIRGKVVENTMTAEWVLNHQFLQLHMKDVADPPQYEALVLIGYTYADQTYVARWCDTFEGKFSAIGHGKRAGDAIEFVFDYPDGPFFNTFTWDPAHRAWTSRMENGEKDGKRSLFAIDTLKRLEP